MTDSGLSLKACVQLLQQGMIPPAALSVECLVKLLNDWQAEWQQSAQQFGADWRASPVLQWASAHWDDLTGEQVSMAAGAKAVS